MQEIRRRAGRRRVRYGAALEYGGSAAEFSGLAALLGFRARIRRLGIDYLAQFSLESRAHFGRVGIATAPLPAPRDDICDYAIIRLLRNPL